MLLGLSLSIHLFPIYTKWTGFFAGVQQYIQYLEYPKYLNTTLHKYFQTDHFFISVFFAIKEYIQLFFTGVAFVCAHPGLISLFLTICQKLCTSKGRTKTMTWLPCEI